MLLTTCCLLLVVAGCIDGEWCCGRIEWVVLRVVALLLISWQLVVVFVAVLGGCCVDDGLVLLVMSLLFPLCLPASYSSTCCWG